ncbi:SIR2 family protein [Effusibacillus consociatus]|uniref:SIR2 family protein n=1 Tax=Effusibacillus consociatus TaxID=1117041 RepID=A0ABV9Q3G4_9BACL
MSINTNDVIFLIGAGCSYDAGIPTATKMIDDIEIKLLNDRDEWKVHRDLYFYIKSAILYSEGIFGKFNILFSIEKFVNVLTELRKKEKNVVYPFIANWNNRLIDLAGQNFDNIEALKKLITKQLINWVKKDDYRQSEYYKCFYEFQKELEHPLRIFSLNYDLCFESNKPQDTTDLLELGFDNNNVWNSARFEEEHPDVNAAIYLYKLHGSITWKRDRDHGNILKLSAHPEEEPDLIFGTDAKLQSIDPYLFYVYEFRKYSLQSKVILVIGYSFSDHYINNLIKQSLQHDSNRILICVDMKDGDSVRNDIVRALELTDASQIVVYSKSAREFLEENLNAEEISRHIRKTEEEVF